MSLSVQYVDGVPLNVEHSQKGCYSEEAAKLSKISPNDTQKAKLGWSQLKEKK